MQTVRDKLELVAPATLELAALLTLELAAVLMPELVAPATPELAAVLTLELAAGDNVLVFANKPSKTRTRCPFNGRVRTNRRIALY